MSSQASDGPDGLDETTRSFIAMLLDQSQMSDDSLYAGLAANLPGHEAFGSDLIEKGRSVFRNARGGLQRAICPRLQEPWAQSLIVSQQSSDSIALAAVIASIIGSAGLGLNAALAAVLVVRMGVRNLCAELPA
jgi:hypothetical protein